MMRRATVMQPNMPMLLTAYLLRARRCRALAALTAAADWRVRLVLDPLP